MSEIDQVAERLEPDYLKVRETLASLGLGQNQGQNLPSFEAVAFHITPHDAKFLSSRAEQGLNDRLIIAPNIGSLTLDQLLQKTNHHMADNGYYDGRLSQDAKTHNRSENAPAWSIGVVLNDSHNSDGKRLPHTGLVFPGDSFERQKLLAAKGKYKLRHTNKIDVQPITLQEQIIGKLTYPEQGKGTTRLIHLPTPNIFLPRPGKGPGPLGVMISLGGHPGAPEIFGQTIDYMTSSFHKKDKHAGVRRVLLLNGIKELNVLGRSFGSMLQLPRGNS